jgi:hypothetical protein
MPGQHAGMDDPLAYVSDQNVEIKGRDDVVERLHRIGTLSWLHLRRRCLLFVRQLLELLLGERLAEGDILKERLCWIAYGSHGQPCRDVKISSGPPSFA